VIKSEYIKNRLGEFSGVGGVEQITYFYGVPPPKLQIEYSQQKMYQIVCVALNIYSCLAYRD